MPCGFTVFVPLQSLDTGNDISLAIYLYRCMKDERAKNDPRLFMLNVIPKVNSATLIDGMNYQCDNRLFLVDIRVYTLLSINHTLFLSFSIALLLIDPERKQVAVLDVPYLSPGDP